MSAFTVSPDLHIQVSDRAHGTHGFNEWLGGFHGKTLAPPQRPTYYPEPIFVARYVREVFQGEARYGDTPSPRCAFIFLAVPSSIDYT
ncbi:MAG: hypothetical protein R6X27_14145 [Candidatus Desulfacyla sp.]